MKNLTTFKTITVSLLLLVFQLFSFSSHAGTYAYVANSTSNDVSVIRTSDNTVIATVGVGTGPISFGNFIATVPEPSPASIPTLSEWTQIALAFMTFGLLFWYQKRESV